jgi:hypothetical protein
LIQPTLVVTRFELRHWWMAPILKLRFRLIHHRVGRAPGLIASVLMRESWRVHYGLSIWIEPHAMVASAVGEHVQAVSRSRRWCSALWTTQWHLTRVSASACTWPGTIDWWELARAVGADKGRVGAATACDGAPVDLRQDVTRGDPVVVVGAPAKC